MSSREQVILITDLDNTVYNWTDFFAPAFRGVVHSLSDHSGIAEDVIRDSFKKIFKKHGSLEYAAQITELDIFNYLDEKDIVKYNGYLFGTFHTNRKKHLRLYEGSNLFFKWIFENNIRLIAATNAPLQIAERRLITLGVNGFFSAIAGQAVENELPDTDSTESILFKDSLSAINDRPPGNRYFTHEYRLSTSQIKPNPYIYKLLLSHWKKSNDRVYILGDSLEKDLQPSLDLDVKTIWAEYGTSVIPENFETLLAVTPWSSNEVATAYRQDYKPNFIAKSLRDVVDIIEQDFK